MNAPTVTNQQLLALAKTYWEWKWLWALTTGIFAGLGLIYVLFLKADTWVATQGLIVRDEATGAVMRLGRFQSQTEMKAAQETILEMARNTQVLRTALQSVGREPRFFGWLNDDSPPKASEVEALAKDGIEVRAPRGAELGTTEVIYLDVKQHTRERAMALNKAVCEALENQLQAVRQARADGVISELTTARDSARQNLEAVTSQLQIIESEAGADLGDLRGLTETNGGGSTNRQVLDAIKSELRQIEQRYQQLSIDLQLARESYDNPTDLLLTPGRLVDTQPGVRKLREGLSDAAIRTSQLRGRFTSNHPAVQSALETEAKIHEQLRDEIGLAVQSLTKDVELTMQQITKLRNQQAQLESRLSKLADIRATYSNVASEVRARSQQLQDTERELAQAIASRDAAMTSSLVTRLDEPLIGENPIGPGRSTILAGATVSGLFFGLGIVFLLTPLDGSMTFGRRKLDYSGVAGRRQADALKVVPVPAASVAATQFAAEPGPGQQVATQLPTSPTIRPEIPAEIFTRRSAEADPSVSTSQKSVVEAAKPEVKLSQKLNSVSQPEIRSNSPLKPEKASTASSNLTKPSAAVTTTQEKPKEPVGKLDPNSMSKDEQQSMAAVQSVIANALRGTFGSDGVKT